MRRVRLLAVPMLILCFLLLACGGINTDEGHRTVVDQSTRWQDFQASIGMMPPGTIAAPWILDPLDGSSVGDGVPVDGLAETPSRAGYPNVSGVVDVYVLPGTIDAPSAAYRAATVPMNDNGEWKLEQDVKLYTGRNTIVAIARYGTASSPEGRVVVSASSGVAPPPGTGGEGRQAGDSGGGSPVRAKNARVVRVAVVAARASDQKFASGDVISLVEGRLRDLHDYYEADSYGALDVKEALIGAGSGGAGIVLDHPISWYCSNSPSVNDARWRQYVLDAVAKAALPASTYDILVVVHAGDDPRATKGAVNPDSACDDFNGKAMIVIAESEKLGTWAHEMGHGLGLALQKGQMLPDLYEEDRGNGKYYPFGYPGYTNLATVNMPWTPYVLMGMGVDNPQGSHFPGTKPPQMEALSKSFFGWVNFSPQKSIPWQFTEPSIETADSGQRIASYSPAGGNVTYVFEARSSSYWKDAVPASLADGGLFVYRLSYGNAPQVESLVGPRPKEWPSYVNGMDVLQTGSGRNTFVDPEFSMIARLVSFTESGARVNATGYVVPADPAALQQVLGSAAFTGPIMAEAGGAAAQSVEGAKSAPPATAPSFTVPDLDLHCYLSDGRHIGMNYTTGKFENPVKGDLVSGDLVGDSEWILLPPELAKAAKFVVSNHNTDRFIEVAKKNGVDVKALAKGLEYKLTPTTVDPAKGIDHGSATSGKLEPGKRVTFEVASSGDASPTIRGAAVSQQADGPPDVLAPLRLPLGIAAGALILATLLWAILAFSRERPTD